MRQRCALLPGLLIALVAGCTCPSASGPWWERFSPFQGPTGPDVVQMTVALIERPADDAYLKDELWMSADGQAVALERKAVLEQNGLRIGLIGGITPAPLLALLTSEKSCPNPRLIQLRAGNTKTLEIGPKLASCCFRLHLENESLPVEVEQAVCLIQVQPSLTRDGRTRLLFTPQLRHGEPKIAAQPSADRTRLVLQEQCSTETYTSLSWEVTLAPNEYVVVGARADRPGTFGHRTFIRQDEPVPVQRLLVIRTNRPPPADPAEDDEGEPTAQRSPSLAAQAARSFSLPKP
jgi:hypothetical protein